MKLPPYVFDNLRPEKTPHSLAVIWLVIFFGIPLNINVSKSQEIVKLRPASTGPTSAAIPRTERLQEPRFASQTVQFFIRGTGFYINQKGVFATALHVIKNCNQVGIYGPRGILPATLLGTNSDQDLAILRTPRTPNRYAHLKIRTVTPVGESVFLVGFPQLGQKKGLKMLSAYVRSHTSLLSDTYELQTESPVLFGSSGGPVVDRKGAVIGIIAGRRVILGNIAIITKLDKLMDLLNSKDVLLSDRRLNHNLSTEEDLKGYVYPVICVTSQAGALG